MTGGADKSLRAVVLVSAGRHPVSGRPAPVRGEAQAVRLAAEIGAAVEGLHAGAADAAVGDLLGQGLSRIELLEIPADADPVAALGARLGSALPDLILAGRQGQGGEDSGLLPYAIAHRLGIEIVADAVALARDPARPDVLVVEQALPRGERRRVTVRLPVVVTIHPSAPPPLPFAFGAARRGRLDVVRGAASPLAARTIEERPYRKRPKLMAGAATAGSAADRLKAATEAASGAGRVLKNPPPEEAAREIVAYLKSLRVLKAR